MNKTLFPENSHEFFFYQDTSDTLSNRQVYISVFTHFILSAPLSNVWIYIRLYLLLHLCEAVSIFTFNHIFLR